MSTEETTETKETTTVKEVEVDVDNILAFPGAETVITSEEKKPEKPSIFSGKDVDMTFLNNEEDEEETKTEEATDETKAETKSETDEATDFIDNIDSETDESEAKKKSGRPAIDKKSLSTLANKLIEKKIIVPFDEDTPMDEYSIDDYIELFEANIKEKEKEYREKTPIEFFDSLPDELKYAAKYVADGGTDMKGLFKQLAAQEEIKELDPENDSDQENIVRAYLHATRFGNAEEIEEEIDGWREHDQLGSKAKKFKPKLDAMQQQMVAYKLQEQEENRKRQQAQMQSYMKNVYETLEPGEINGIKLDRKTQEKLYTGLVQANYNSVNGSRTNQLGHLLEKYQFVEPNHGLIAEALWLLSDPDAYRDKIRQEGATKATSKNVRMLKTEQANKDASSSAGSDEGGDNQAFTKKAAKKISRPTGSFFRRNQ